MKNTKLILVVAVVLFHVPGRASAAFGEENALLAAIQAELLKHGFDFSAILQQTQQAVNISKESVSVIRDAYNGVQYFQKFDPSKLGTDLLGVVKQSGIVKQGDQMFQLGQEISQNGLNGGNFNLRTPMMIYNKVTGSWMRVETADNYQDDIELQKSDVRRRAAELAARRFGEDGGVVDMGAASRWARGDRVDPNIITNEANIRAGANAVSDLAAKSAAEAGDTGNMTALKAAYITAQMTSISAEQLAMLNKQMAEQNSWKSIEETERLNAKEKETLLREQDKQNTIEEINRLKSSKGRIRPENKGWHAPSTGGFF